MIAGAWTMVASLAALAALVATEGLSWLPLLAAWLVVGIGYSTVQTPSGRLLRRSAHPEDRPALFAAQFALSHACWLLSYPLSGWLQTGFGTVPALLVLALLAVAGIVAALRMWPADDPVEVAHSHDHLPVDHPHLAGGHRHSHAFVIDDLHRVWPAR